VTAHRPSPSPSPRSRRANRRRRAPSRPESAARRSD
jgi:hypothetical protein